MLNDFRHYINTIFVFGKDCEKNVGKEIKKLGATKVLICHDGGKFLYDTGLLDSIKTNITDAGMQYEELGGIKPNPRSTTIKQGIQMCRDFNIDFLLALGGGSSVDTCKAISAGFAYEGDVWELTQEGGSSKVKNTIQIGVVLTYPASGAESSKNCVITNDELEYPIKSGIDNMALRPIIVFENPELSYTLPRSLTACGIADSFIHILERYMSPVNYGCMDYLSEGLMKAILDFGPKVLANPNNYEYRAEMMYITTIAQNGTVGLGRNHDWATHFLGHELSALYDTPHAISLTVIHKSWMLYVYKDNIKRFARFAREVFAIKEEDDEKAALLGIEATNDFYKSLNMPTNFSEANIPTDKLEHMAKQAVDIHGGSIGGIKKLNYQDCLNIFRNSIG